MSIEVLRLVNGEDIIADVERPDGDVIVLNNPAKIALFPTEEGAMGIGLIPWIPYSEDDKFEILESNVMCLITAPDELINEYNEKYGSGIVTPPKNLII